MVLLYVISIALAVLLLDLCASNVVLVVALYDNDLTVFDYLLDLDSAVSLDVVDAGISACRLDYDRRKEDVASACVTSHLVSTCLNEELEHVARELLCSITIYEVMFSSDVSYLLVGAIHLDGKDYVICIVICLVNILAGVL